MRALDDLLGAINLIDWLEGIFRGALAGDIDGHRIALPHPESSFWEENSCAPWSLNQMRELLEGYRVATYGRGFNSEEIWVHVKRSQARWAEYILQRAGAPVAMATVDERNAEWAADPRHNGALPPRWADRERTFKEREARG